MNEAPPPSPRSKRHPPENLILKVAESILKALEYLHKQGWAWDLKAGECVGGWGRRVKLGDFGVASFQQEGLQQDDSKV